MRARRFPAATFVFELPGGTEDNSLWCERALLDDGTPYVRSVWVPTNDERAQIAAGANISLTTLGAGCPPVAMRVTDEQPGRG